MTKKAQKRTRRRIGWIIADSWARMACVMADGRIRGAGVFGTLIDMPSPNIYYRIHYYRIWPTRIALLCPWRMGVLGRPQTSRVRFEINRWTVDILVTRGTGNFFFFSTPGTGKYEIPAKIFRGKHLPTWSQRCRSAPSAPPTCLEHCTSAVCHHIRRHHAWLLCVLWAACTGFTGILARQQVRDFEAWHAATWRLI
jgi:hypothetical protein